MRGRHPATGVRTREFRTYLALFLLSMAVISFQIGLMQILSIVQWHHFANMIISVALLGFGCSGTVLSIGRRGFIAHYSTLLPLFMLLSALGMVVAVPAGQRLLGGFDSYLLLVDRWQYALLGASQLLFFLPIFCAALAIGLVFIRRVDGIGTLYAANLLGSACGGILILGLMWLAIPERLPALSALMALVAALLVMGRSHRLLAAVAATGIAVTLIWPPPLQPSQYKAIRHALALPDANIKATQASPYGLLELVSAPALRHAPELSLSFTGQIPPLAHAFNNGDSLGPWPGAAFDEVARLLGHSPLALPYAIDKPARVLIVQAGTGLEARYAQLRGANEVFALDRHPGLPGLLAQHGLRPNPDIRWSSLPARAFLGREQQAFDLILLPSLGTHGGDAGLSALSQQYLLTTQGMVLLWRSLARDGIIRVSSWIDAPPRNSLRLAATLATLLEAVEITDPRQHLAAIRSWGSITFIVKRSPLSANDIQAIRHFCERLQFDPVLLPEMNPSETTLYHTNPASDLERQLEQLLRSDDRRLLQDYVFDLQPATDDRPFFSQFLRWRSLPRLRELLGERSLPVLELGYLMVLITFVQLSITSLLLIILPLLLSKQRPLGVRPRHSRGLTFCYFGSLGLGFMFFEIALLHQLIFYLGQPLFAAAGAITLLLLLSGTGSYLSQGTLRRLNPPRSTLGIALLMALMCALLPKILSLSVALSGPTKVLLLFLAIAPVALLMGLPFPTGLRELGKLAPRQVPWALAINGCLSVIATPLATIIAVEAGFSRLMLLAACAYAVAAWSGRRL